MIAEIAQGRLSAVAKREVALLLALDPSATLASVSTGADEIRSPSTAVWHYVNFAREANCRYEVAQYCVNGSCAVGAIDRQLAVLACAAPDVERLKALKYVVHSGADLHEPLLFARAAWAEKSCRITATEGFRPAGHLLDAGYGQRWSKTLVQQMAAAARRLAAALNRSLGEPLRAPA